MNVVRPGANFALSIFCVLFLAGCGTSAATMAAKQPESKDLTVLSKGTSRDKVVARLGAPLMTTPSPGRTVDLYQFVQGYSAGARTARVVTHSTLSIATLGIWEVAGTAIEGYARGTEVTIRVVYDEAERLVDYSIVEGEDAIELPQEAASPSNQAPASPQRAPIETSSITSTY